MFNWLTVGPLRALLGLALATTTQGSIAALGGGVGIFLGVKYFGLSPKAAFVAGYFIALAPTLLVMRSGHYLKWRFRRWDNLEAAGILDHWEVADMKAKAKKQYRKDEGVA